MFSVSAVALCASKKRARRCVWTRENLMAFFLKKLTAVAAAAAGDTFKTLTSVAEGLSLDNLQGQYGDPTGMKALLDKLDFTYLTPKLAGEWLPVRCHGRVRFATRGARAWPDCRVAVFVTRPAAACLASVSTAVAGGRICTSWYPDISKTTHPPSGCPPLQ
jgi:hypothetical protein